MREPTVLALLVTLAAVTAGCGGVRAHPMEREASRFDAGLIGLDVPIMLALSHDETTPMDGVSTRIRRWEGQTPVYAVFIASIERSAPFTGPRDEILAASMGDEVRGGSLGTVSFDYREGVFTARADARVGDAGEGSVQMQAFMTRTRLVVVACGGRPAPVERTMGSITVRAYGSELFFLPRAEQTTPEMHSVWGLGFSCRMPGGVAVDQSEQGTMRYTATGDGYTAMVYVLPDDGEPIASQAERAARTGTVLEDTQDFLGGVAFRQQLIQRDGRWSALLITELRAFQFSGEGTPTDQDRERATAFFHSCVY